MKLNKFIIAAAVCASTAMSCTKLDEKLASTITKDEADSVITAPSLLLRAYNGLQLPYQDQSNFWALQEMTSDEAVAPTRGGDWDDNGAWRALKLHTWDADHVSIGNAFRNLLQLQFYATNVLEFNPTPQQAAEAKFLRALSMFSVLDGWNQVPFREPNANLLNPPNVLVGDEATNFIIGDLEAVLNDLPAEGPAYTASQNAARALLMKLYLNKGAISNRQAPTFDPADMEKVIQYADAIIGTGKYSLATNYFDNFAYNNNIISTENIFTQENGPGLSTARGGNAVFCHWAPTLHYAQVPSGWNGFATVGDFYDLYEATDTRLGGSYPGFTELTGTKVGYLIGQQYNKDGVALEDRKGNKLIFTKALELRESGNDLEVKGIRVVKYVPDMVTPNGSNSNSAENDYVFLRYADVLLMKAEALLRLNQAGALAIVNDIRVKRNASPLADVTLDDILDERGRELYWEGWRRQDLIRFGKFLQPWQLKPSDDPKALLFPIPNNDLAVNPNLNQNEGYAN
ncbi:RagB/SusD family nutrient uptake outer membrane protein [Chitinophaga caeni]|uniref:RagB/SusD family nutrient uptake outer membrane protein n=1 Tax=Chitinophaga caeni TaxID=2029983 RepID=A0A291QRI8_9BACT|nr:RagB/SusD family nutrient uptake outer membrane protein [Chitinophaga caeni]ATL46502.1 RagB/SusD family nutrient uptake outer membrane protein [Chitinophaga caeni]